MTEGYKPCDLCGSTIPDEPNELDDLRAEVERLRGEAERERAAVVAWLRVEANAPHPIEAGERALSPSGRGLLLLAAIRIERGKHRREGDE